jgi:lysozyme family protein
MTFLILNKMTGIDKNILHGWVSDQLKKVTTEEAKEILQELFEDFYLEEVEVSEDRTEN